jgi:hypothetical protein
MCQPHASALSSSKDVAVVPDHQCPGAACSKYQDETIRNIQSKRVQCDEIWSFVGSKEKNTTAEKKAEGCGDCWTWTAIDDNFGRIHQTLRVTPAMEAGISDVWSIEEIVNLLD